MKIFRVYNQNRKIIWFGIAIVAIIILLAKILPENISKGIEEKRLIQNNVYKESVLKEKENPDISITLSDKKVEQEKNLVIDQFIRYCNAGQIEEAYALLSDNCKSKLYPTIDFFKEKYINKIFRTTKLYSKEFNYGSTYKINLYENMTSTGRMPDTSIEDYFTIEYTKDAVKLNISGYITTKEINISRKNQYLQINIVSKDIYKEYEEYIFEVKNLTNKDLLLDSMENTRKVYLIGSKDEKYYSMLNEKTLADLTIPSGISKKVTIKFNNEYSGNGFIDSIVFSDIVLDKEAYNQSSNKIQYKDRTQLEIKTDNGYI